MSKKIRRDDIATQAFTVLFGRGIMRIAQLIAFLILARLMTVAEFGWFGILTTAIALAATLGSLGLRQSLAYEVGQERLTAGEALGTAILVWFPLALVSAAIVYGLYGGELPGVSPLQGAGVIFVGVAALILLLLLQGIYLGTGAINAFTASEAIPRLALLVFVIVLALTATASLPSALWANVGSYAVAIPVAIWLARRGIGPLSVRLDRLRKMIPYGILFALNMLLNTLCLRISMFVIGNIQGATAAGEFYAAARVYEILLEAATAFGVVLFSNATRQDTTASVLNRNVRIGCWIFWLFAILACLVWFAAPLFITAVMGAQYAAAGASLQILALSLAPAAACKIIYPSLAGSGRPGFGTPVIMVSLAATFALAIFMVPRYGVNGGAAALVIGQYILFVGYILSCRILFKIRARDFLLPRCEDAKSIWFTITSKLALHR